MSEKKPKLNTKVENKKTITVFESKEILPIEMRKEKNKNQKRAMTFIERILENETFGFNYYKYFYENAFTEERLIVHQSN